MSARDLIVAVRGEWLRAPPLPGGPIDDDPAREALVIVIETASGLIGLGECNHHPAAAHAFLHYRGQSRTDLGVIASLIGHDPRDHPEINYNLRQSNFFSARRGIGAAVLSAVDMALWDLAAQIEAVPLWQLLWGDAVTAPRAYYTLYTGAAPYEETKRRLDRMVAHVGGFRAVKVEPLIDCVPEDRIGDFVRHARQRLGPETEMLVDFGYRMPDSARAIAAIVTCAASDPFAIETPCPLDAVQDWAATAAGTTVALAGAELAEHPDDFSRLMDAGVRWLQPWANRLGITGARDVIIEARARGHDVMMAGWNATAIGMAASVHLGAGIAGAGPQLEYADRALYEFALRRATGPEPVPQGDSFALPTKPGLGVRLDNDAVAALRVTGWTA